MGMYTALSLGVRLDNEFPQVTETLSNLIHGNPVTGQNHPFFATPRGASLLRMDSFYFDYRTHWEMDVLEQDVLGCTFLSGVSNIKNYDNEINKFLDWLSPHMITTGFIGWTMYEEDDFPTILMRHRKGEITRHIHCSKRNAYMGEAK